LLIQQGFVYVAMLLDQAIKLPPGEITLPMACGLLPHIAAKRIRSALLHPVFKPGPVPTGGRPTIAGIIPTIADVTQYFGYIGHAHGDYLPTWAYAGATEYRAALHFVFIARRAHWSVGRAVRFGRAFLSDRLGVSKRTTRNYEKWLPVQVTQNIRKQGILPMLFAALPLKPRSHQWLEMAGKRYPALRGLAAFLMKRNPGETLYICTQESNSYALADHWREVFSCRTV
jgi:hypothetical protein